MSAKVILPQRQCRLCGCIDTDCRQCIRKTGEPCYWVAKDLCSACSYTIGAEVKTRNGLGKISEIDWIHPLSLRVEHKKGFNRYHLARSVEVLFPEKAMISDAEISECGLHRYSLTRTWNIHKQKVMFIGLNPSRADHVYNDPTITRCINFAKKWSFGGLFFANIFSFRTPDPRVLTANINQAVGPDFEKHFKKMLSQAEMVICCWGSWSFTEERTADVLKMIKEPWCLGKNKDGQPKHPLYLSLNTEPELYK